jgi:X-Pro dipeptidyl-peptidase
VRWQLIALVAAVALAGCLGTAGDDAAEPAEANATDADLPDERYEVQPVEVEHLETSDGEAVENAIYRPDTDEPVPVFINFSPYWGDTADERGDPFAQYMIEEYVPRGYAVVLSSIRGTGHSEGCFQIGSDREVADLKETVERFADADWSNGNVIAGGKSYDSTPQNGLVAKDPPEGLVGLFHVSGITDMYRYTYRQGVPYGHGPIFNTYYYGQSVHEYGVAGSPSGSATYEDEDADSLARAVDDAACTELPEMQASGVGSGVHGLKTDYWTERDWNRHVADSDWNGSIFFVHGLQDWNVKPDHILPWLERLPDQVDVKGWLHQDTEDGTGHVYPMREDWNATMLRWLEHAGRGADTGVDWTVEVASDDGVWREHETWPPEEGEDREVLVNELTAYASEEGNVEVEGPLGVDDHDLERPLRYAGQPTVDVEVEVQGNPDPVFTVVLYEEDEDGERTWVNEGVLRGVYRNGLTQPDPFPQGEHVEIEIPLYPQDDVLEPGHEWIAVFGDQPRHAQPTAAQLQGITYTDHGGAVHLPLAPMDAELDIQPEPTNCFAC